ncbi:hypothetical protein [Actinomycetospora atypica]|uniref:Uncharacterized protein n=1 Tax=Actinomycetospora atypica TaxID=1290095 RepID=A0ABV9YKG6_9PSEU
MRRRVSPFRLIRWLESTSTARVVANLAAAGEPVTHAALDAQLPDGSVQFLRAALVNHGVLASRDENLALERWPDEFCSSISDDVDRKLLRGYATWHHLHQLRTRSTPAGTSEGQLANIKSELRAVRTLCDWLDTCGRSLRACT